MLCSYIVSSNLAKLEVGLNPRVELKNFNLLQCIVRSTWETLITTPQLFNTECH
jgi:hypothetical protein